MSAVRLGSRPTLCALAMSMLANTCSAEICDDPVGDPASIPICAAIVVIAVPMLAVEFLSRPFRSAAAPPAAPAPVKVPRYRPVRLHLADGGVVLGTVGPFAGTVSGDINLTCPSPTLRPDYQELADKYEWARFCTFAVRRADGSDDPALSTWLVVHESGFLRDVDYLSTEHEVLKPLPLPWPAMKTRSFSND